MRKNQTIAVYKRDDVDSKRLHFVGWATPKQTMGEIAGKFLPLKTDFWRRTVRANGCLIVEYYKPTIDEQAEWAGRPKGHLGDDEAKMMFGRLSVREQKNGTPVQVFNRHKFRSRVQPHIAHREPQYSHATGA